MKIIAGRILKPGSVALALAVGMLLVVAPYVHATSATVTLTGVEQGSLPACTPGNSVTVDGIYTYDAGTHHFRNTIDNVTQGTQTYVDYSNVGPEANTVTSFWWTVPALTVAGDTLRFTVTVWNDAGHTQQLTQTSIAFNCSTGALVTGGGCGGDGRINDDACAGPVALYCDGDTLEAWAIDPETGEGTLVGDHTGFSGDAPAANTLLESDGNIELWQLDTGEYQVNADQGEGKTYAFVFNGCPYNGDGYNANIDPNE